jgi:shikimate dehydrogenase
MPIGISGQTRVVGIIGDPVAHSRSPAMHNAAFRAAGLNFTYVAFHVRAAQLGAAMAGIRALDIAGVNVTVPHKEGVIPFLDSLSDTARRCGAVNTIVNRGGHLYGENTDVIGFRRALAEAKARIRGARVLLIGAGGGARSVLEALAEGGVGAVIIANRTRQRAQRLADHVAQRIETRAAPLSALRDARVLREIDLVVNATSIGLRAERFIPVSYMLTPGRCVFFDLLYASDTDFLRRAASAGRRSIDGTGMLLHQGAAAFTLWTHRRPPLEVMRAALKGPVSPRKSKLTRRKKSVA